VNTELSYHWGPKDGDTETSLDRRTGSRGTRYSSRTRRRLGLEKVRHWSSVPHDTFSTSFRVRAIANLSMPATRRSTA
jgi:hypothetical protein